MQLTHFQRLDIRACLNHDASRLVAQPQVFRNDRIADGSGLPEVDITATNARGPDMDQAFVRSWFGDFCLDDIELVGWICFNRNGFGLSRKNFGTGCHSFVD